MIIREKLSKRAVVKEDGLGRVYLQDRRLTPIKNLARATLSPRTRRRQSLMDVSVDERRIDEFEECPTSETSSSE